MHFRRPQLLFQFRNPPARMMNIMINYDTHTPSELITIIRHHIRFIEKFVFDSKNHDLSNIFKNGLLIQYCFSSFTKNNTCTETITIGQGCFLIIYKKLHYNKRQHIIDIHIYKLITIIMKSCVCQHFANLLR